MVRPAAKPRRPIVLSSDEEDSSRRSPPDNSRSHNDHNQRTQLSNRELPSRIARKKVDPVPYPPTSSTNSDTRKPQPVRKSDPLKISDSHTLDSFFNKAAQKAPTRTDKAVVDQHDELLEDIEDDFDGPGAAKTNNRTSTQETWIKDPTRKRSLEASSNGPRTDHVHPLSRKFIRMHDGQRTLAPRDQEEGFSQPWTENYAPQKLEELAVHHKKVGDVRVWLQRASSGQQYQKLLVLRGAAGSGKTATVSLLSELLRYKVLEWKNPELADYDSSDYVSTSVYLADFLSRAGNYNGLELVKTSNVDEPTPESYRPEAKSMAQLMLMEEFPSTGGTSSTALVSFRNQILQYLAASIGSTSSRASTSVAASVPLVMIISESVLSENNSRDNFTAHRLLGGDILHHPGTAVIDFNPIAPTFLSKALKLVIQKHTRTVGRAQVVSPTLIQKLSEIGDIRNAVSTLEYLHSHLKNVGEVSLPVRRSNAKSKVKSLKTRTSGNTKDVEIAENSALSLIALRHSTLGLFHAVGKVVYNKREERDGPIDESATTLTNTDAHFRPPPDISIDSLKSTAGTDTSTFLSALHENYLLSCFDQYGDSEATLDSIAGCIESLGDADILGDFGSSPDGRAKTYYAVASEGVRQDELSFHVGVMGMQQALPYPVKRQAASQDDERSNIAHRGGKGDAHRMFYPMDLKLWRRREEIQGSLDYLTERALDGSLTSGLPIRATTSQAGKRSLWGKKFGKMLAEADAKDSLSSEEQVIPEGCCQDHDSLRAMVSSGLSARKLMLLERLPYLRLIATSVLTQRSHAFTPMMKEIDSVTRFSGVGVRRNEESDDETETIFGNAEPGFGKGLKVGCIMAGGKDGADDLGKLVLSDDDIVDD